MLVQQTTKRARDFACPSMGTKQSLLYGFVAMIVMRERRKIAIDVCINTRNAMHRIDNNCNASSVVTNERKNLFHCECAVGSLKLIFICSERIEPLYMQLT